MGLGLLAAGPVAAQPADDVPDDLPAEGDKVRREGEYGGVRPGAGHGDSADKGKPRRPPAKKTLLWIGFTAKEGGASELFFQAVEPFTVSQRVEGKVLVVLLEGLKAQDRQTRRPLDTRFFETSVARVTARKVGARRARKGKPGHAAGIEVRIAFKDARDVREAAVRSDTGTDKLFYAHLAFAPPANAAQAPEPETGPSMQDPEGDSRSD